MKNLKEKSFCIVGAGNIGNVLINRLLSVGIAAEHISVDDVDAARVDEATAKYGVKAVSINQSSKIEEDIVIIATPPKTVMEVVRGLRGKLHAGQLIISMAAAVPLSKLRSALPADIPVVRVLPNPPSMLGLGMNPVAFEEPTSPEVHSLVEELLAVLGRTVVVQDDQMTWCVGLAGAAMRTVLPVLEGMTQAGIEAGLSAPEARLVASQIMAGTAALALETDLTFEQIKALTPMETVDEKMVAGLFLDTARATKQKVDGNQAKIMEM